MPSRYDHLSKDELLRLLQARDLRDKTRFGLVWEANEIERDKALNDDFVALDLIPELSCGKPADGWSNLIIEGDNFDALRYLRMTHSGRVKCIFIDPPYNTGNNDFVYNDNFVDKNDAWKNSKWCEFLYQRLVIARDLLSYDGVLFCCINDDNRSILEMLLEKVFPGKRVGAFVWRTRNGANDSKEYFRSIDHEFVLCYANPEFSFQGSQKSTDAYSNPDNDPRGPWVSSDLGKAHTYKQRPNTFYHLHNPESDIWYACDPDIVWRFASESKLKAGQQLRSSTIEQIIREKKILWPESDTFALYHNREELIAAIEAGTAPRNLRNPATQDDSEFWEKEIDFWIGKKIAYGKPRYKRHLAEIKRSEKPFSSWLIPSSMKKQAKAESAEADSMITVGGTTEGSSLLQEILGNRDFDYPKPLSLVEALLRQSTQGDDIVVDFFAGSGTTAHAVLSLNEKDGGNRSFILVSNAESTVSNPDKNICRDVCAKRVKRVIEGYSIPGKNGPNEVEGLGGNFAYLRARRIKAGDLLSIEHDQVWSALQLHHFGALRPWQEAEFLCAEDESQTIIYIPDWDRRLAPAIRERCKPVAGAVIYSWQPGAVRQCIRYSHVEHRAIPATLAQKFRLK